MSELFLHLEKRHTGDATNFFRDNVPVLFVKPLLYLLKMKHYYVNNNNENNTNCAK